jgi:hypothetical protein
VWASAVVSMGERGAVVVEQQIAEGLDELRPFLKVLADLEGLLVAARCSMLTVVADAEAVERQLVAGIWSVPAVRTSWAVGVDAARC